MSVFARKSTQITNRDASPQLLNDPGNAGSLIHGFVALVTAVTSDSSTSTYRFFQVPSNAVVRSLKMWTAALSTSVLLDIGIYDTTQNGGLVVTDNLFANNVDASGAIAGTDYRFSALAITTAGKQLWDLLGLSADPSKSYDVVVTVDATITAGGAIVLDIAYGQ